MFEEQNADSSYGDQTAYTDPSVYGDQSGAGDQTAYTDPSAYGDQSGYSDQSSSSDQSGYADQSGYTDQSGYGGGGEATTPETVAGTELMASAGLWSGTFYQRFEKCMGDMGVPAPTSLFTSFTTAVATIRAIQAAVAEYGTEVTIAELVGAGVLSDALLVVGALAASAYVGVCIGCLASAGIDMSGIFSASKRRRPSENHTIACSVWSYASWPRRAVARRMGAD